MFIGTGSALAQSNKIEVNAIASEKTEALRKFIKFDSDQADKVYLAVQEYTQATLDLNKAQVVKEGAVEKIKAFFVIMFSQCLQPQQLFHLDLDMIRHQL
jgi:intergrase/recombinase